MALHVVLGMSLEGLSVKYRCYSLLYWKLWVLTENSEVLAVGQSSALTEYLAGTRLLPAPRHAMPGTRCSIILAIYIIANIQVSF